MIQVLWICPSLQSHYSCGEEVRYACAPGFTLHGTRTRMCGQDGRWSGAPPVCADTQCPAIEAPTNGGMRQVGELSWGNYNTHSQLKIATLLGSIKVLSRDTNIITCQADIITWHYLTLSLVKLTFSRAKLTLSRARLTGRATLSFGVTRVTRWLAVGICCVLRDSGRALNRPVPNKCVAIQVSGFRGTKIGFIQLVNSMQFLQ